VRTDASAVSASDVTAALSDINTASFDFNAASLPLVVVDATVDIDVDDSGNESSSLVDACTLSNDDDVRA
jgi:hypothetical protein